VIFSNLETTSLRSARQCDVEQFSLCVQKGEEAYKIKVVYASSNARLTPQEMIYIIDMYQGGAMKSKKAKVFWTGRSQAIRLPKEFRFQTDTVLVRREGSAVVVEPAHSWPDGYVESFAGLPEDFSRPAQGKSEKRTSLR